MEILDILTLSKIGELKGQMFFEDLCCMPEYSKLFGLNLLILGQHHGCTLAAPSSFRHLETEFFMNVSQKEIKVVSKKRPATKEFEDIIKSLNTC